MRKQKEKSPQLKKKLLFPGRAPLNLNILKVFEIFLRPGNNKFFQLGGGGGGLFSCFFWSTKECLNTPLPFYKIKTAVLSHTTN